MQDIIDSDTEDVLLHKLLQSNVTSMKVRTVCPPISTPPHSIGYALTGSLHRSKPSR